MDLHVYEMYLSADSFLALEQLVELAPKQIFQYLQGLNIILYSSIFWHSALILCLTDAIMKNRTMWNIFI